MDKDFSIPADEEKQATENEVFTSSDPNFWDYVRLKDITKNTGIEPNDFHSFYLKENLDNAADFQERCDIDASIIVHITCNEKSFEISIRNSNPNNIPVFTNLIETFNYKRAYSSKSNQYRVTRGAQGDAIKKMSTMTYALNNNWDEPLIIQHNKRIDRVYVKVDRKHGEITPKFANPTIIDDTDTEIVYKIPPMKEDNDYYVFKELCKEYALFNTHISYKFHFSEYDRSSTIDIPACHPIVKGYDNPNSVYCYSDVEFGDFLNDIYDKKMSVYDALSKSRFREIRQSGRFDDLKNITLVQLTSQKIAEIFHDLKKSMLPMSKLPVPYDIKYCKRKQALINRYQQIKPAWLKIDTERAVYKEVEKVYEDGRIRFPFGFEVLAIPIIEGSEKWNIIGGVNYSASVNNIRYFQGQYTNTYKWTHEKTGQVLQAGDIMQIIRKSQAGEDIGDESNIPLGKQRQQCVLIVHLVAPRIEYQSYGKSSLTLEPFQSVVAKTIEQVVSRIPLKSRYNPRSIRPPSVIECLREFLKKRWEDVRRNPSILDPNSEDYDAMTQSTVWYNLRKQYLLPIEEKYVVTIIKENTREDVTAKISSICENDLEGHPKREQLGIFASPRATMYVDGSWHNVDIDEIPALAKKGTDVVFVEKRGIVEIVKYIADMYGFAFVNTQGHFAEYPKDLIREIIENGGNVAILTDFDCAGIHIAEKVISDVIGEEYTEFEFEEDKIFEVKDIVFESSSPFEIIDASLAPPEKLPANVREAKYSKTADKSQEPRYPEYSGRVVRLGIDIQTLQYFVSKDILMTNKENTHKDLNLGVGKMKERVGEEYPKHTDPKKQQPGKNVITPIITYAKLYHSYLKNPTNPSLSRYKRYEYIYDNFEYLTGISLDDLYSEDMERVIENRKTARRIEMDSVIEDVKPPAFAQFICGKIQEFFPVRNYNRAIKPPTGYFGDKFNILPESIKKLFLHITSAADAAAKPTEQHIELEQMAVNGLFNVSNTKEANKNRISEAVAQHTKMKIINSKCAEALDNLEGGK
jgi:hypothetical protein